MLRSAIGRHSLMVGLLAAIGGQVAPPAVASLGPAGPPAASAGPGLPWWLIVLAVAAASLLAWGAVRLRLAAARRRERELRSVVELRTRELVSLGSLTEKINRAVGLEEVLEHVWDSFRMVVPYNRIGFADFDPETRLVRAVWARSDSSTIMIDTGYSAPIDSTSLGRILESGRPRIIGDLERYLESRPTSTATEAVVAEGMRSSLTVPLKAMGRDVGFLFFSSQSTHAYTGEHVRLLESISGQLSLAIEKSRLYDRLLDTTRQLEEANAKLEQLASTDGLTGVANRRVFDERLGVEWRRCGRSRQPLSLLMIDIDHFKRFNDLHGHVAGDTCLRAVAEILTSTVARAADLVARYGGEEFCAILPETTHQQAAVFAEELRRKIQDLEIAGLPGIAAVTVSIGVATEVPDDRRRPEDLVRRADASLYIAKNEGRNMVHSNPRIEAPEGLFDVDA